MLLGREEDCSCGQQRFEDDLFTRNYIIDRIINIIHYFVLTQIKKNTLYQMVQRNEVYLQLGIAHHMPTLTCSG